MRPEILFPLYRPIGTLKGVGPRIMPLLEKLAGPWVRDLLYLKPQGLIFRPQKSLNEARHGEIASFRVEIDGHIPPHKKGAPWRIRARDETGFISLVFFKGSAHLEAQNPVGSVRYLSGKVEVFGTEIQMAHPDFLLPEARKNELLTVEPVYPATAGITPRLVGKFARLALSLAPEQLPEWLEPSLLAKMNWPSWSEALNQLHHPTQLSDLEADAPARQRLAYDELLAHQLAMQSRKRMNRQEAAPCFAPHPIQDQLRAALPFALTGAQDRVIKEIAQDLTSGSRMNRLVQGDVGSGKTLVALMALLQVMGHGGQGALMAPTEILARQHYERLSVLLESIDVATVLLTGRDKGKARLAKLAALASGETKLAFGTHALFQDDVVFDRLGLAVIDEQHRFGVNERSRLLAKGAGCHLLSLSATPIPRTLALTQFGELDLSILDEKPPGRKPITTAVVPNTRLDQIAARLDLAAQKGTQAYWICPLVAESEDLDLAAAEMRAKELTETITCSVGLVHGQMPTTQKDDIMTRFAAGEIKVLVSTTVVEVGVDVPNATIMVIEHAERFGLAQLHQLRGRVGRGAAESACILLYDPPLSKSGQKRLETLKDTEDGFLIAEQDWKMRGEGDVMGYKQSGFPDYRFADPEAHDDLLAMAAKDAQYQLSMDPKFQSARGKALRFLGHLFDWRSAALDRMG